MHERSGASIMTRGEKVRNVSLLVLGTFVVVGTGITYRAVVDRWKGDPRGTADRRRVRRDCFLRFDCLDLVLGRATRRLEEAEAPKLTAGDTSHHVHQDDQLTIDDEPQFTACGKCLRDRG